MILEREFAQEDPRGFLARFADGAIFAGRAGIAQLLPLASGELPSVDKGEISLNTLLLKGGYPALHTQPVTPPDWFASYVATYLERDVRQTINVQNLSTFQRFLKLCAGRVGQLLNMSALASETGITHSTARSWLSVLESSGLVYLLPPYHRNFGKRLVKTPKLYFIDTGLASWLLSIRDETLLSLHPLRGALFENWVVSEFLKARYNQGLPPDLYFWRDNNGLGADLVFEVGTQLQVMEIKAGQSVTKDYIKAGQRSGAFADSESLTETPWLVYGGDESYIRNGVKLIGWRDLAKNLTQ